MSNTLNEWLRSRPDGGRVFAQERLIVATAESIWEQLEQKGMSKADLAKALGKSKPFVTQILDGTRNMTLRTLSDIAFALGLNANLTLQASETGEAWESIQFSVGAPPHCAVHSTSQVVSLNDSEYRKYDFKTMSRSAAIATIAEAA